MIRQRLRQFREAGAAPTADDYALARAHLAPPLLALYEAQHPRDIVHTANTARWLIARGHTDADLVAAALLHDIGKGQQRRADRVAHVVAAWLGIGGMVADGQSRVEMRRAVDRSRKHAAAGAAMLRAAGASERCVVLTARHHGHSAGDPLLELLQQADAAT